MHVRASTRVAPVAVSLLVASALLAGGCARFDDRLSAQFTPGREPGMVSEEPRSPSRPAPPTPPTSPPGSTTPGSPSPEVPPPCADPDPAVIATCLDASFSVAALPGSKAALVAEAGGRIMRVEPGSEPREYARVDTGGGRLVAIAPSPHAQQDRMVFGLVVGDGPSRVVRVVPGDVSKPVVEVPAGTSGGLAWVAEVLMVGVGDEVLSFPGYTGVGVPGPPETRARGLGRVTGLCTAEGRVYAASVTDRGGSVRRVDTPQAVWTWPDQRVVGGCAASTDAVAVALPDGLRVDLVPLADGAVRGQPQPLAEKRYGRLTGVAAVADGALVGTTTNKSGGTPVATDDRAIVLPSGGGSGDSRV